MHTIILFAHGARDPAWATPLLRLRDAVAERDRMADVRVAFLEFMSPILSEAIDAAALAGAQRIDVVPVFLAQGGHVKRDLPVLVEAARGRYPDVAMRILPALGEAQSVIDAMAAHIVGD